MGGFPGEVEPTWSCRQGLLRLRLTQTAEPRRPLLLPLPHSLPHRSSGPTCPSCGRALGEHTWGMGQCTAGTTPQLPAAPGCREDGPELGFPLWSCDVWRGRGTQAPSTSLEEEIWSSLRREGLPCPCHDLGLLASRACGFNPPSLGRSVVVAPGNKHSGQGPQRNHN